MIRVGMIGCGSMAGSHAQVLKPLEKRKPEISAEASLRRLQVIWKLYEAEERGIVADLRNV